MQETVPQWVQEARAALTSEQRQHIMLWVQALRSGEYLQGRNFLTQIDNDGMQRHCCMGVACVIAMREGVELEVAESEGFRTIGNVKKVFSYIGSEFTLPYVVQKWLGAQGSNVCLWVPDRAHVVETAGGLNDEEQWDFMQIADAIEATYLSGENDGI